MSGFQHYWLEFLTIATVHLLAVASPGPDFAVVLKHSISYGRRTAIITSIGVGVAILVHVAYSLLGIGILIQTTPWLFTAFSYAAAAYLVYLGYGALRSQPAHSASTQNAQAELSRGEVNQDEAQSVQTPSAEMSDKKAFWVGFLTNGLNPKATLFFLSLFAVIISTQTPNSVRLVYGVYLAVATGIWFCTLSYFLSTQKVRQFIQQQAHWFDRIMGFVLILLALKLVTSGMNG